MNTNEMWRTIFVISLMVYKQTNIHNWRGDCNSDVALDLKSGAAAHE